MRCSADRARHALACVLAGALAGCSGNPSPPVAAPVGRSAPPTAVSTPPPDYPEQLACNGVGGRVDLRIHIGTDGRISESQVQRSSGNTQLDDAAQAAVAKWRFNAGLEAGRPKAQWIAVPMTFHPPVPRPERCFALDEQQADALMKH